jgi:hypothetical protein
MNGFGRKKGQLPNPSTNITPSTTQQYLSALGMPEVQQPESKPQKKKNRVDAGGQLFKGSDRAA